MAKVELIMPKMGESIIEATILRWVKGEGDEVDVDDTIVEIATDKVDSEIPSPVEGKIAKILFEADQTVAVGEVIALIETEGEEESEVPGTSAEEQEEDVREPADPQPTGTGISDNGGGDAREQFEPEQVDVEIAARPSKTTRFYSPLVRNIAKAEGLSMAELEAIEGTGLNDRITKRDVLAYLKTRTGEPPPERPAAAAKPTLTPSVTTSGDVEIIEMDRMRKLIADHMINSKKTSAHVTSFVEADVTNMVNWRNKVKMIFQEKFNQKITFTPIFIEAIVKAINDFPRINASVDGDRILVKKNINIGMATALANGNLIVPVIRGADQLNLLGLTKAVNDLAERARSQKLKPEEIQDGTFTLTNVGTFGNVMGTPIINQPQVAILATGAIRKKPAVIETQYGDVIGIRQMMYLSLSYDHRIVDGYLGGSFLRKVADYLEQFEPSLQI